MLDVQAGLYASLDELDAIQRSYLGRWTAKMFQPQRRHPRAAHLILDVHEMDLPGDAKERPLGCGQF